MKRDRKYSGNIFSQTLLGLLVVFYVSIFVIQATHIHESLNTTVSQEEEQTLLNNEQCKICAYFARYEKKELFVSTLSSFVPLVFQTVTLITGTVSKDYPVSIEGFTNRGPPHLLV